MDVTKINELFRKELKVINMGLDSLADNLRKEEVQVLQLDWGFTEECQRGGPCA